MATIQRLRQKIIDRDYYLSSHAEDEMLDEGLERDDIENAILKGRIEKKLTKDIRGTRYRFEGPAKDGRQLHILCRFKEDGNLIIIRDLCKSRHRPSVILSEAKNLTF